MEESEAKLCIQAFLIKIKAFIIKHKRLYNCHRLHLIEVENIEVLP